MQFFLERDIVGMIAQMMRDFPLHSAVQQACCEALLHCNGRLELRSLLNEHKAIKLVRLKQRHAYFSYADPITLWWHFR